MNKLAPRQGVFAVILLASFCLQVIALTVSNTKVLRTYQLNKGNQIANQLIQDAQMALASKDRISLAILINRYQVDNDVAQLIVQDNQQNILLQTGQQQAKTGAIIQKAVRDRNQEIGQFIVTMKGVTSGEIISNNWLFIVLSAVIHVFLWLLYGYVARPTDEDLRWIGERVQEKMAISQNTLLNQTNETTPTASVATSNIDVNQYIATAEQGMNTVSTQQSINDYLQTQQNMAKASQEPTPTDPIHEENLPPKDETPLPKTSKFLTVDSNQAEIQFRFYDAFNLMDKVAPEVAKPYLHLCEQLLQRACNELFNQNTHTSAIVRQQLQGIPTYAQATLNGKSRLMPINLNRTDSVDTVFGDENNFSISAGAMSSKNYRSAIQVQSPASKIVYKSCTAR